MLYKTVIALWDVYHYLFTKMKMNIYELDKKSKIIFANYRNFENISIPPEDEAKSIFEYIIGLEYLENGMAT